MEDLVNPAFWRGRRVFVTGHTGFKGSWLALWLQQMGAEVHGFALAPDSCPGLFQVAGVEHGMQSTLGDIRDLSAVQAAMTAARPEIVLHLAAQALVPQSYVDPVASFATNAMGTVHVLEGCRHQPDLKAVVVVSSDKCYENREQLWGYRETDPMGGHDPYSASKGCTELIVSSYRRSFLATKGVHLGSARAGNVIGGGDWTATRLVPDVLKAFSDDEPVVLRNPSAIRPWQHVLEPLSGYLLLAQRLLEEGEPFADSWNFGPDDNDAKTVAWVVERIAAGWGPGVRWTQVDTPLNHEAHTLKLDCSKARVLLGWQPRWHAEEAVSRSLAWYQAWRGGADMYQFTLDEIAAFGNAP